jgi:cardiolipin synthase A/B
MPVSRCEPRPANVARTRQRERRAGDCGGRPRTPSIGRMTSDEPLLDRSRSESTDDEAAKSVRPESDGWFVEPSPYPARSGNSVRPLVDGEPAFRRICEAIDAAHFSVWTTVAFLWDAFQMPDGRGSFFDVLGRAAERGLDVRVIFWRPGEELAAYRRNAFWGSPEHIAQLDARGLGISARWDQSPSGLCQHQKSWLIDAGHDEAIGFVGGINQNPHSVVAPGHHGHGENHDVYVEISGPSTMDIQRNFVERWNGASERTRTHGLWGDDAAVDLPAVFPELGPQGQSVVQIQRTMPTDRDGERSPNSSSGETTIFDQYRHAISAARRSIYIENQALDVPAVHQWLRQALERGVEVVAVVPSIPESLHTDRQMSLNAFSALGAFENFTFAGLAGISDDGARRDVYVHSKLMLIDDHWATIGSCNLHAPSLFTNAEMNASFWDPVIVRQLRCELFEEHLGETTEDLDAQEAHRRFGQIARENRRRWEAGSDWEGLALQLDPATHARQRFG